MRKIVLVFTAIVLTVSGFAQKTADIGIWGGSSAYWGDIKEAPPMQTFNLNMGAFFRYNFNARVALRTMFLTGSISSEGVVEDIPFSFKKNVQDISVMMEVNYLKYILGNKKTPFTPYILGGLGVTYFPYAFDPAVFLLINPDYPVPDPAEESVIGLTVPFGFGIKFSIGERFGIGAECQMRKLFSDKLDNADDPLSFEVDNVDGVPVTVKYTDFLHNNDWPGYVGIHLTYKIFLEKKACPAYDRKYW
ncbi:type IX secretion system protein PorG [Mariniphaga sediminis]|jgi:hypothetical protein|uniref:type IX secretion system protein PorG n=1 Tax=Mariniphaga sediminis TaxID=1628158 RepID=UPI003568A274